MAGIEGEQDPAADGIADVELRGAGRVALGPDAEQLWLDRIQVVLGVDLLLEDGVQGLDKALARAFAVGPRPNHMTVLYSRDIRVCMPNRGRSGKSLSGSTLTATTISPFP